MAKVTTWFDKLKGAGYSYLPATSTWRADNGAEIASSSVEDAMTLDDKAEAAVYGFQKLADQTNQLSTNQLAQYALQRQGYINQTSGAYQTAYTGQATGIYGGQMTWVSPQTTLGGVYPAGTFTVSGTSGGAYGASIQGVIVGQVFWDESAPSDPNAPLLNPPIELDDVHTGQKVLEELHGL